MAEEARKFYEVPDGLIAESDAGRFEVITRPAQTPGLLFIKIAGTKPSGRSYFQFVEVDPEMARLLARKIDRVAGEVEAGGGA